MVIAAFPPTLANILAKFTGTPDGTKFLRDDGSWQTVSAGSVSLSSITSGTLATTLALGTQVVTSTDNTTWLNGTGKSIKIGSNTALLSIGSSFNTNNDARFALGQYAVGANNGSGAGLAYDGAVFFINTPGFGIKILNSGTEKYRLYPTLMECSAISLGGTIGSSTDPGAGGLALTGNIVSTGSPTWYTATGQSIKLGVNSVPTLTLGYSYYAGGAADDYFRLGKNASSSGYLDYGSYSGVQMRLNAPTGATIKLTYGDTEKYRFAAALAEMDRLSLGGTIGSSTDPGAGGLALTGELKLGTSITSNANAIINPATGKATFLQVAGGTNSIFGATANGGSYLYGSQYVSIGKWVSGTSSDPAQNGLLVGTNMVHNAKTGSGHFFGIAEGTNSIIGACSNGGSYLYDPSFASIGKWNSGVSQDDTQNGILVGTHTELNAKSGKTIRLNNAGTAKMSVGTNVEIGTAALATGATSGFINIPSCAGNPSGTPTPTTGLVPMCVDSTNGRLYLYYGGAWHYATLN